MKSLRKVVVPLLTAVFAIAAVPEVVKADNPITRPKWPMPGQVAWGTDAAPCDPNLKDAETQLDFGNCFNQNTLFVRLTGAQDPLQHPNGSMMKFVQDIVQDKLLRSSTNGSAPAATFASFLDLTLKRFLDADTATTIDYNAATYLYRPVTAATGPFSGINSTIGFGGYEASPLFDRTCLDIPLVGTVCLHGYLWDVDNEVGAKFFSYDYNTAAFQLSPEANADVESGPWSDPLTGLCTGAVIPGTPCGPTLNGQLAAPLRDDDDGLKVRLQLNNVKLDLFFEPPTDSTLTDVKNDPDSATYTPEDDLSNYLKAYGVAELGTIELIINLRVASNYNNSVQPHTIGVGFELQDVFFDSDFQFIFKKGPYCNNNLGTTESPAAGQTYTANALERPFDNAGAANYPGLVSDTNTNANPGPRTLSYMALDDGTWPNGGSSIAGTGTFADPYRGGGSGAGRDKIGVNTSPYEYNDADERWSDNPNNCRRPADACNLTTAAAAGGNANRIQNGGPEWTGNTNTASCEWPNVSNNSDDATFKISEQITSIVPYLQGEIKVVAEDKFKNRSRPNPGYYLGPTSLLDLGSTLAGISFDWPLRPGTDYVFIDAILDSDVDGDDTNEFWADTWGVMMPFNFALGVSWNAVPGITAPVAQRLDQNACVQKLSVLTGYRDGFGEFATGGLNPSDDPFLTKTYANKGLRTTGALSNPYAGLLSGFGFPLVTTPGTVPAAIAPANAAAAFPGTDSYALGFALHQNTLSAALYDAVVKGLLCADIDSTGQYAPVTDQVIDLSDILNTSTFQMFFPALYDNFPDRPMRLRVIPLLRRYTHNAACPAGNCANSISSFSVTSAVSQLPELQEFAEAPYVIMGGPPIGLSLIDPSVPVGGVNEAFSSVDAFGNATRYIYPDLSIVIPNLLLEFYVYGETNNWHRVFAIDLGVAIGLNIDIVQTPTQFANLNTVATAQQATWYPIGCDPAAPSTATNYCSGGYAYTKRVLRLAGLADPEINAIIEYSELTYGNPNTRGTSSQAGGDFICGSIDSLGTGQPTEPGDTACVGGTHYPVADAFNDPAILKGAISNLIGLVLSVDVSALVEVGFDLGAFLNIPLAVDAPYIGPSYVVTEGGTAPNVTDLEETNGSATIGNGFGDYLVGGVSLDLSRLSANYLIQQIDYLLDGTDGTKPFGLDLDIGLAPNAKPMYDEYIPVPQATIQPPVKVSAQETIFRFAGYDQHDGQKVNYSWRVDNGVWSVFSPANEARITGLLEGKHTIEVKAINSKNMMQDVPARYTFVVDSIAPKIRVVGDRTVGSRASFFVEAADWLTPKEDVRVAYRLDDGRWTNFGYNKKISLSGLREGRHTLRVRAADNTGNTAETAFSFSASDGGFGCSTTSGAGSLGDILVMLVLPALVLLRKRLF